MLLIDPEPQAHLDTLYRQDAYLAERVDDVLDELAEDHGQRHLRRRAFSGGLFAITVRGPGDSVDYAILWEVVGADSAVRYIGPATFM